MRHELSIQGTAEDPSRSPGRLRLPHALAEGCCKATGSRRAIAVAAVAWAHAEGIKSQQRKERTDTYRIHVLRVTQMSKDAGSGACLGP